MSAFSRGRSSRWCAARGSHTDVAATELRSGAAVLSGYPVVLWDFDGVIKESVSVKSDAFARLFEPFGAEIAARVRRHHEMNTGMSRFEKIPLYLSWAGEQAEPETVARYCARFADAVKQ